MTQMMLNAMNVLKWQKETDKSGFNDFGENRVYDAFWNGKEILGQYGKCHCANDPTFEEVLLKTDLFSSRCTPFPKTWNRIGSIGWWHITKGLAELHDRFQ